MTKAQLTIPQSTSVKSPSNGEYEDPEVVISILKGEEDATEN